MIAFREVSAGAFRRASFDLAPGAACRLALASATDLEDFLALLLGSMRPEAGEVVLFGRPLADCSERETLTLLRRIGFAWGSGGFVSNLKVWENIMLPLWYHEGRDAALPEQRVTEILGRLGMEPGRVAVFLGSLPGGLPAAERRFISIVRAVLKDPDAVVYAGVFDGLDEGTRRRLETLAQGFHGRKPGRVSLYAAAGPAGLPAVTGAVDLRQGTDGGIHPWA